VGPADAQARAGVGLVLQKPLRRWSCARAPGCCVTSMIGPMRRVAPGHPRQTRATRRRGIAVALLLVGAAETRLRSRAAPQTPESAGAPPLGFQSQRPRLFCSQRSPKPLPDQDQPDRFEGVEEAAAAGGSSPATAPLHPHWRGRPASANAHGQGIHLQGAGSIDRWRVCPGGDHQGLHALPGVLLKGGAIAAGSSQISGSAPCRPRARRRGWPAAAPSPG